ncbi:MAG: hypothetical protein K2M44_03590, partial [Clostridia bacterium]|nr:hypothetical protein [Clostridia bacterium]
NSLTGCLNNNAFSYTYTDEDGNTVSASEMVAGKKYNVKATLKQEYAGNFEFVDASGNVLPDATASTSHEFDYGGDNSNNSGNGVTDSDWYKRLLTIMVCVVSAMTVIMAFILILVGVLIKQVKEDRKIRKEKENQRRESDAQ